MTAPGTRLDVAWTAVHSPNRRDHVTALLSYVLDSELAGSPIDAELLSTADPWDLWWMRVRSASLTPRVADADVDRGESCQRCRADVRRLIGVDPPGTPEPTEERSCGCLLAWARRMRSSRPSIQWPALASCVAMVKPDSDIEAVTSLLSESYRISSASRLWLSRKDVRRLYPDAYGTEFVATQDAYYTSSPVTVLTLAARPEVSPSPERVKADIRAWLGDADELRNHLHMPDNPGETLCDLAHLTRQPDLVRDLYGRHDRAAAAERIAHYRSVLARR